MSALCLSCGLCCDGTLFASAPLAPGEAARLAGRVTVVDAGTMALPCRALDGTCCTLYDERPAVCRQFNCLVLAELTLGQLTFEAAREVIDEVLARRRAVAEVMGIADERQAVQRARELARAGALAADAEAAMERLTRALFFLNLQVAR